MDTMVQVAEFPSTEEATIAQGMLVANGIGAVTKIESAGGAYPQLAARVQGGTGVHVPVEQLDEARRLLEDVGHATSDTWVPEDGPDAWRGSRRVRWAGRVIVSLLLLVPLVLIVVDAIRA